MQMQSQLKGLMVQQFDGVGVVIKFFRVKNDELQRCYFDSVVTGRVLSQVKSCNMACCNFDVLPVRGEVL